MILTWSLNITCNFFSLFFRPISGASMNPARSLGPAIVVNRYEGIWVYIIGPICGTVLGAWAYNLIRFTDKPLREITKSGSFLRSLRNRSMWISNKSCFVQPPKNLFMASCLGILAFCLDAHLKADWNGKDIFGQPLLLFYAWMWIHDKDKCKTHWQNTRLINQNSKTSVLDEAFASHLCLLYFFHENGLMTLSIFMRQTCKFWLGDGS